jgi:hypothetical protein
MTDDACSNIKHVQIVRRSLEDQRRIAEAILDPPEPAEALQRRETLSGAVWLEMTEGFASAQSDDPKTKQTRPNRSKATTVATTISANRSIMSICV